MATTKLNRRIAFIAAVAGICAGSTGALAGSASQTFQVKVNVVETCTITSGSDSALDFVTYDPGSTLTANAKVLSVTCTNGGSSAQVTLDPGLHPNSGTPAERQMADSSNTHFLTYILYYDSGLTHEWSGSNGPAILQDGTAHDLTVYGSIASGQSAFVASYSDTVKATISF